MRQQETDPAADFDLFAAIKRLEKMEIEIVDSLLRQIDESPQGAIDRQKLLELRSLCQLRNRLLNNLRSEYLVTHGAA